MNDSLPLRLRSQPHITPASESGRLPGNVVPISYDIELKPDLEAGTYVGKVVIEVDVKEDSRKIILHSLDLKILHVKIKVAGEANATQLPDFRTQAEDETLVLPFNKPIHKGKHAFIEIHFSGSLLGKQSGFYRGSYKTLDGKDRYYATTQMQPCEARRAIPCFDEPALKATFKVAYYASPELVCLSNMNQTHESKPLGPDADGKVRKYVTFAPTPPMSTYLMAFALGEFNYLELDNSFHVPIRVYTTPDRDIADGRYAAEITSRALKFYEKQFGAKYPLPKLDLLAVAAQGGAMENWGLIIFADRALLTNKTVTSASAKLQISNTVLHEEAHLWFGDLVTCSWWESLWLNESFATWVSWYGVNAFYPQWQVWNNFTTDILQTALTLDSLRSSHPIEVPVATSGQINQIFDAISYQKGSSVLRMLATYLGEDVFIEGVRPYIAAHAYGNTITEDLWAGLSDASGEDVAALMRPWTKKIGYPVVTVTEDERTKIVTIKQKRYLSTGGAKTEDDTVLWPVFLNLKSSYGLNNKIVLTGREGHFLAPSLEFFKINAEHTAVYRTLYTPRRLMKLALDAKQGRLSVADRAGLIADSAALATSGHQSSALTFYFVREMLEDSSFFVWKQIVTWFRDLRQAWLHENDDIKAGLQFAARDFISDKARELGWDFSDTDEHGNGDDRLVKDQFKTLMFTAAGAAGDSEVIQAAKELFVAYTSGDRNILNANLRAPVFALAVQYGGLQEYNTLRAEYYIAKTSEEKFAAIAGLGYARDDDLLRRTLRMLFDEHVPFAHLRSLLSGLSTHAAGSEALLDIMLDDAQWERLRKRAPPGIGSLTFLMGSMLAGFSTFEEAERVEKAFEGRDVSGLEKVFAQGIEEIRVRAGWVERSSGEVHGWLRQEGYLRRRREQSGKGTAWM